MANEEHLKILKQGADAWNEWRKQIPQVLPELSQAGLSTTNSFGVSLGGAKLARLTLANAQLRRAHLSPANLSRATARWAAHTPCGVLAWNRSVTSRGGETRGRVG